MLHSKLLLFGWTHLNIRLVLSDVYIYTLPTVVCHCRMGPKISFASYGPRTAIIAAPLCVAQVLATLNVIPGLLHT